MRNDRFENFNRRRDIPMLAQKWYCLSLKIEGFDARSRRPDVPCYAWHKEA